ncbi:glycoside hydrolase family 97 catalytic domain-containing protein [Pelomonas sp. UHG3]|uniref:Glycoside hydrolase family 97 catalytic domain-containing protein n=1 Tax=Roseateles hydrophilus TaxID=2975054 RepID=A0ACC6CB97_9BURK|nr:glycoside hydrolase family 97 protein [Pelomonas sp. UHG3]MCY4745733.1 glycoside hydrolase family 97 catalytic domain-containing protein [Pelomonas sp. UHG3]
MRLTLASLLFAVPALAQALSSPDGQLQVDVSVNDQQQLVYTVQRAGQPVLLASRLGLVLAQGDFANGLKLVATSPVKAHREQYTLAAGKKRQVSVHANEQRFTVANAAGQRMTVTLRAANDGLALRYTVDGAGRKTFKDELTSFAFPADARAWLQPMSVAKTGWKRTNPSYEEHYLTDIPVGTAAPSHAGWVFPALFRAGANWVALTEAGMDGRFHASRLASDSTGGTYRIGLPEASEVNTGGHLLADVNGPLTTPWRVLAIGPLKTVMESTLGTDLAAPAIAFDHRKLQPGHASWSWAILKDDATVFDVQKRFIDYAADMGWNYTLVDADWDRKIGDAKMKELADYAKTKGVGLLAWYNSSGAWNDTEYSPKNALLTKAARAREFARVKAIGIQGLKVDFFGGDGASSIAYYVDILKETAAAGLLLNFHGATLPRGWSRTYPQLMTVEAVKGFEFATFEQKDQDKVPGHAAMLPFTRNLFDPMDFTPVVFHEIPNIKRATRNGFELAQSVLFLSGIQHYAETPEGMATVPAYVKTFMRELPRAWDEVRFLGGEPGRWVAIARRAGQQWFVAGLNADDTPREVKLDLAWLGQREGQLITDGAGPREFAEAKLAAPAATLTLAPKGGFVARFR